MTVLRQQILYLWLAEGALDTPVVGWALHEEYFMNEQGVMANSTLLDYRMPTALDVPMNEAIIVEVPARPTPWVCAA